MMIKTGFKLKHLLLAGLLLQLFVCFVFVPIGMLLFLVSQGEWPMVGPGPYDSINNTSDYSSQPTSQR